jgi:hypothetical protein
MDIPVMKDSFIRYMIRQSHAIASPLALTFLGHQHREIWVFLFLALLGNLKDHEVLQAPFLVYIKLPHMIDFSLKIATHQAKQRWALKNRDASRKQ